MKKPSQRTIPVVASEQGGVEKTARLVAAQERVMRSIDVRNQG